MPVSTTPAVMGSMDLFQLAAANADPLLMRFETLVIEKGEPEGTRLRAFAAAVSRRARVGINMRPTDLIGFFLLGKHQNVYEWAISMADESKKTVDEILKGKLGSWYPKRLAFDRFFTNGERFRYGALNMGDAGAHVFGEYCAVFTEEAATKENQIAYLSSDSLKTYVKTDFTIDEAAIRNDLSPHTHRHFLATLKYHENVVSDSEYSSEDKWPSLCSLDYLEVIFTWDASIQNLEELRLPKAKYDYYRRCGFEDFGRTLDAFERVMVDLFVSILKKVKQLGLRLIDV